MFPIIALLDLHTYIIRSTFSPMDFSLVLKDAKPVYHSQKNFLENLVEKSIEHGFLCCSRGKYPGVMNI